MESFDFNVLQLICQLCLLPIVFLAFISSISKAFQVAKTDPEFHYEGAIMGSIFGVIIVTLLFYGAGGLSIIVEIIKRNL